ncbi:MAG: RHS repeat-associated core domain-containing protein [Gammaproteobacteria bacterium]|nr:RHS repeat-associated core domain-containing protein [Gammaproteobacteria bacterium]
MFTRPKTLPDETLAPVALNSTTIAAYTYDGDGNRVKAVVNGETTYYPFPHYEETTDSGYTKYYYAGGDLVAFNRSSGYGQDYGRRYVFKDHLGSTSVIVNGGGTKLWEERFYPYGESRYTYRKDQGGRDIDLQTPMRYTGQRFDDAIGLYYYNARYYDPALGRFAQADTIVPNPGSAQSLNRYSYSVNNPIRYIDPSGYCVPELCPGDKGADDPAPGSWPPPGGGGGGGGSTPTPWWTTTPPPIGKIHSGGDYGTGFIVWGGTKVSVYHPPSVRSYPSIPGYYPRHGGNPCGWGQSPCMGPYYFVMDYWYGEDYVNVNVHPNYRQNPVLPGSWQDIYQVQVPASVLNGRMEAQEIFAGIALGRYEEIDSDAPDPQEMGTSKGHIDSVADGLSVVANQQAGITKFFHKDTYFLQRSMSNNYRVIIMVQYNGAVPGQNYITASGPYSANPPFSTAPYP